MKKTTSLICVFAIVLLCLASCNPPTSSGTATIVIGTETPSEYTLEFKDGDITDGLLSALDLLEIEYVEDGGMLSSVGDLSPTGSTYIWIYTSVDADKDVTAYATTMEYNGVQLTSTGKGAKTMSIVDGAIIYIGTISFG